VTRRNAPRQIARPVPVVGWMLAMIGLAAAIAIVTWLLLTAGGALTAPPSPSPSPPLVRAVGAVAP
jgi:hypothetical protein